MLHITGIIDLPAFELDVFVRLTEAQLRSRRASERALLVAESPKIIGHALDARYESVSLLMEHRQLESPAQDILTRYRDVPLYTTGRDTLAALTGYGPTYGILCIIRRPSLPAIGELCVGARRMVVLEGIMDPINVGAIFYSAIALHIDGVLVVPICHDPPHRRAMRVSMDTVFQVPWTYIGACFVNWPQSGLARLWALGSQIAAMTLSPEAPPIEDFRPVSAEKLATILGAKGDDLSLRTVVHCDYTVCIPTTRGIDSLNVATASIVAFWQLGRRK